MISNLSMNDLDRFNTLGLLVNPNFTNVFNLSDILNSKYDKVFGYYDNSYLVGFIHVSCLYDTMDVVNIVVANSYRRKGIGNKLLNYAINYFKNISSIMLEVNEKNSNAINLYEKNGFKVINRRKKYYGSDDALVMKRDVSYERC